MAKNYWMFVQTRDNFEITKSMGFRLHGLGAKHRRRADRMQPNDNILYYVRDTKSWLALATIKSKAFEDRSPLWNPTHRGEDFRYRVKIEPRLVLEDDEAINALLLAPRLEYLKRWVPELWPLAFMDSVHLLPAAGLSPHRGRDETDKVGNGPAQGRRDRAMLASPSWKWSPPGGDDLPIGALVSPAPGSQEERSPDVPSAEGSGESPTGERRDEGEGKDHEGVN